MNYFDIYFSIMGGAPPRPAPAPVYTPPPKPAPVDNSAAAREKTAANKRRGRTALITNEGKAGGLGDDEAGQKKTLGGY